MKNKKQIVNRRLIPVFVTGIKMLLSSQLSVYDRQLVV
ncbi:hypothetical protein BCBMB205_02190 [Bacillus sp. CN2]|nr:hypothetical protein BCBMB205_02190 [Bacillus velezensis]ARZ56539.1 hypothetical protein BAGQ_0270 [Bacillus velezensis]GFR56160.1 hypothetical protein BCBMB205_02190 [Bacillus sp. CN2]